jgi:hypothetical protein
LQEDVDQIQEMFSRCPLKATRRASLQLSILQMTVLRVVHNRLYLHSYKVQIVQALKLDDKPRRFQFAKDILSNIEADENYLRR